MSHPDQESAVSSTVSAVLSLHGNRDADPSAAYDKLFGPDEIEWFKGQTGIQDDAKLKQHVLNVQSEALKVFPYGCIRLFTFTSSLISRVTAYPELLRLGREMKGAILLDFACCFGDGLRHAVVDGFPVEQTIAADLHPEFWTLGHKLFCSTPDTFPVHFVPCDVFNASHIAPSGPLYDTPQNSLPSPLSSATTLTEFQGHVSVIYTSAFFHLFDEEKQRLAAQALASLLSPLPGSLILGIHMGGKEPREIKSDRGETLFLHSPKTWAELWDGKIFKRGTVKVEANIVDFMELTSIAPGEKEGITVPAALQDRRHLLDWSVTRL